MVESDHEAIFGLNALVFGILIILAGFAAYFGSSKVREKYVPQGSNQASELA